MTPQPEPRPRFHMFVFVDWEGGGGELIWSKLILRKKKMKVINYIFKTIDKTIITIAFFCIAMSSAFDEKRCCMQGLPPPSPIATCEFVYVYTSLGASKWRSTYGWLWASPLKQALRWKHGNVTSRPFGNYERPTN